jgi:hypothetical protein
MLEALPQFSLQAGLEWCCWLALPQTRYRAEGLDRCKSERVVVRRGFRGIAVANCANARYVSQLKAIYGGIDLCKRKFSRG